MSRIERLRALLQTIPLSYRHSSLAELTKTFERELQDADAQLWSHIEAALNETDAVPRHAALIIWQKWLNESDEPQVFSDIFTQAGYWLALESGLRSNDRLREKFCLHLLLRSLELLDQDINVLNFRFQVRDKSEYVAQYRKFCSIFQIIVFDRYPNQIDECLASFPHIAISDPSENGAQSLVPSPWWAALFAAALRPTMLDTVRQCIGYWLLGLPFGIQAASEDYKSLLTDSLLPWAAQGSLLVSTIRRNGDEVHCLHGDRLASFCSNLIRECPRDELKFVYIRAILHWINNCWKDLGSHAVSYILKGIADVVETSDWQVDDDISDSLMSICRRPTLSSVQQLVIIDHCRRIRRRGLPLGPSERLFTVDLLPYQDLISIDAEIARTNFACLRGNGLVDICEAVKKVISASEFRAESPERILHTLSAVWDECDTQEHPRSVVQMIPQLILDPKVLQLAATHNELRHFLSSVLSELYNLAARRIYAWNPLAESLRAGFLRVPNFVDLFELEPIFEQFVNKPPAPNHEFLLDVAISRTDTHGRQRFGIRADEGRGNACMFDILNRLRSEHRPFARRLFGRLLEPWLKQLDESVPVPYVSKWKRTSQLQGIILLLDTAIDLNDQDDIMDNFNRLLNILALEPMPRFRFLLEWAVFSLSLRLRSSDLRRCGYADYILDHLDKDDQTNPKFTSSMVRIATLVSIHSTATEAYANRLLIRLAVLSTSPRVAIRHEAQWHFPIAWKHHLAHLSSGCAPNPILAELAKSIQNHEKYIEPPRDRILNAFDPETDRTLAVLFQGGYLAVDPPDEPLCTIDDFKHIWADENRWAADVRTKLLLSIPVGTVNPQLAKLISESKTKPEDGTTKANHSQHLGTAPAPLQTKSQSLRLPALSSAIIPHRHHNNPNSPQLVLVASLISSTFNLGGVCRAAECFGISELHIDSLSVLSDKSFRSLSVTSEKHITIRETPASSLANFLRTKQDQGFSVVAVEQTDTSIVIPGWDRSKEEEKAFLPKMCVVVMGAENTGVPAAILGVADRCLEIGQWGITRSLNVQTAAAVVCYEWRRIWGGQGERER